MLDRSECGIKKLNPMNALSSPLLLSVFSRRRARKKKSTSEKTRILETCRLRLSFTKSRRRSRHPSVPTAPMNSPEGSLARRGGSARLCGRIDVVKADAAVAAVADVVVVVAGLCRLEPALPPSSRAVRTAPPPPQLTEEDNMRLSLSRALAEEKKNQRQRGKEGAKAWESRIFCRSL